MKKFYICSILMTSTGFIAVLVLFALIMLHPTKADDSANLVPSADAAYEIERILDLEYECVNCINKGSLATIMCEGNGGSTDFADASLDIRFTCATEKVISFAVEKSSDLISPYGRTSYFNIDPETGNHLTLKDVFGEDYHRIVFSEIHRQMMRKGKYLPIGSDVDIGLFIDENRAFYMKDGGNTAVIVFDTGEVASDSEGVIEVEVPGGLLRS